MNLGYKRLGLQAGLNVVGGVLTVGALYIGAGLIGLAAAQSDTDGTDGHSLSGRSEEVCRLVRRVAPNFRRGPLVSEVKCLVVCMDHDTQVHHWQRRSGAWHGGFGINGGDLHADGICQRDPAQHRDNCAWGCGARFGWRHRAKSNSTASWHYVSR